MKKENQPGNYQLKADLEGNYLIDKEHKATKRIRSILGKNDDQGSFCSISQVFRPKVEQTRIRL